MNSLPHFKWRNCYGDVTSHRFARVIMAYWEKVALPALQSAEQEVDFWARSEEGAAVFVHSEKLDQHLVTAAAMCLSLQSIWERQLRSYLLACARDHERDERLINDLQHAHWDKLQGLFERLRGVPMHAFLSYPDLDLLAQLGNVCRHGAGRTANRLWLSHPELWPSSDGHNRERVAQLVEHMHIGTKLLGRFAGSIARFWEMIEYLYNESITSKHHTLERALLPSRQSHAAAIAHFNIVIAKAK